MGGLSIYNVYGAIYAIIVYSTCHIHVLWEELDIKKHFSLSYNWKWALKCFKLRTVHFDFCLEFSHLTTELVIQSKTKAILYLNKVHCNFCSV